MSKKPFSIYPRRKINSCQACPYQTWRECTFTDGPQFKDRKPPLWIHEKCPIAKDEKESV